MTTIARYTMASMSVAAVLFIHLAPSSAEDPKLPGMAVQDVQTCLPTGNIHMDGPLGQRMADCMDNLITAWDLDRLIKPFRDKTDGPDDQWRGDYWGKWFTALAWGYAHEPTAAHRQLFDRAVKELIATQGPDGNIGTFAGEKRLVGAYDIWARQCVILGLVAYYDLTADKVALDAACRELDCLMNELEQKKLRIPDLSWPEFKGLAPSVVVESGALLYQRTGQKRYRDFAEHIVAQWNEPSKLASNGLRLVDDALAGKPAREVGYPKAYEQMYCFIGVCELYRATGNRKYLDAAIALAKNIRADELFVTGTGSERERWFHGRTQQTRVVVQPAETCVTTHWMYLCWQLLRLTGDPIYADEMETSLDNALLGALMPDGRWWAYHEGLMGQRVPSWVAQADIGLSCCVVSGSRGLMLTPFWAVMQAKDGPVINLYFPGKAEVKTASGGKVLIEMATDYPREGTVQMSVKPDRAEAFTLALRIPAWSQETTLKVNGQQQPVQPGTYAKIQRNWAEGDRVELTLDMRTRVLDAPDGSKQVALKRGPIVLAFDNRLISPEKDAVAVLERNAASLVDVKPNPQAAKKAGAWMAFDVPFLINGTKRTLTMCDYASAGNRWSEGNLFRTWLPQPLNLGAAYETGTTWHTVSTPEGVRPETPAISSKHTRVRWGGKKADRILFLGNSITFVPPAAWCDWKGNWGMAASAEDKDYVHLLVHSITELTGRKPGIMVENIADFERQYATYDVNAKLKEHLDFKPDIVVVAIGENVPALGTEEAKANFKASFGKLLAAIKNTGQPAIYVRGCFWTDKTKEEIMRQSCAAVGGVFIDISGLGKDESNYARSERKYSHDGVAGHPGDKGMQSIADAILSAMATQ